jgi:transposase
MAIEASVKTSGSTVYRTKKRFVEISLEAALSEKPRPGAARKLSGRQEAQLVALACSDTPKGCARWTLKLLANAFFEHQSVSRETIRRRLDDNDLKPWQKKMWCIAKINGEYIAPMEDLLDLYAEPHDPKRPVERDTRTSRTIASQTARHSCLMPIGSGKGSPAILCSMPPWSTKRTRMKSAISPPQASSN